MNAGYLVIACGCAPLQDGRAALATRCVDVWSEGVEQMSLLLHPSTGFAELGPGALGRAGRIPSDRHPVRAPVAEAAPTSKPRTPSKIGHSSTRRPSLKSTKSIPDKHVDDRVVVNVRSGRSELVGEVGDSTTVDRPRTPMGWFIHVAALVSGSKPEWLMKFLPRTISTPYAMCSSQNSVGAQ